MDLFSKEKDLIFKITNLVLLLWLVGSITIAYVNLINMVYPDPVINYEDYKLYNCDNVTESVSEDDCDKMYKQFLIYNKTDNYHTKRNLITSIGSIIIVSSVLYLLNKKKGGIKK